MFFKDIFSLIIGSSNADERMQALIAYSMIGLIKRNFIHMDSRTFIMLYKALVRPRSC